MDDRLVDTKRSTPKEFAGIPDMDCRFAHSAGVQNMRDPGILAPRHFFLPGTFCEKMESAWKGAEVKDTILPGTCCETMKSAWKSAEVKDTILPGTCCEKMKSAWKGAEVKDTILPGTCYEKMKSAWKGVEVKDTSLLGPS